MSNPKNDIFYVASLLEYTARMTKNKRRDIAAAVGLEGIKQLYRFADISHCLPFEQTSDELVRQYHITTGNFSPEAETASPPDFLAIGKNYANIVAQVEASPEKYPDTLYDVFCSKIGEWMTLYNNAFYYSPQDYQAREYLALKK